MFKKSVCCFCGYKIQSLNSHHTKFRGMLLHVLRKHLDKSTDSNKGKLRFVYEKALAAAERQTSPFCARKLAHWPFGHSDSRRRR
jgi:hypothetical protein